MPKRKKLPDTEMFDAIDRAAQLYFDSMMPSLQRGIALLPAQGQVARRILEQYQSSSPDESWRGRIGHFLTASANRRRPFLEKVCGLDASEVEQFIQRRFCVGSRGIEKEMTKLGDQIGSGQLKPGNELTELSRLFRERDDK